MNILNTEIPIDEVAKQRYIISRGIPASGKSSYAKKLAENYGFKILNYDSMRQMLFGRLNHPNDLFDKKIEAMIKRVCTEMCETLLQSKHSVIIDNTNLNPKEFNHWVQVGTNLDIYPLVLEFKQPFDVLLKRNSEREFPVPTHVIRRFWDAYPEFHV